MLQPVAHLVRLLLAVVTPLVALAERYLSQSALALPVQEAISLLPPATLQVPLVDM
jgi:hypothetical protein